MRKIRNVSMLMFFCLGLLLLTQSGCVSGRTKTTLKPVSEPGLNVPDSQFYIADLKLTTPPNPYNGTQQRARILDLFRKECLSAYPKLFTESPNGSIPLGIELDQKSKVYMGKTMGWMYGTLLVCGLILPCPGQTDESYDIQVSVWGNNPASPTQPCATAGFKNEYHTWCSILTPAALIEIPGESDFPKISGSIFNIKPLEDEYYRTMARQLASATAHAVVDASSEITKQAQALSQASTQVAVPVVAEKTNDVSVPVAVVQPQGQQAVQIAAPVAQTAKTSVADIPTQLKKLDELKSLGLITEDEYDARKTELTGKM